IRRAWISFCDPRKRGVLRAVRSAMEERFMPTALSVCTSPVSPRSNPRRCIAFRCRGRLRAVRIAGAVAALLGARHADASAYTWDGGGADFNFSTANNWNPNGAPANNGSADLHFAGSNHPTPNAQAAYTLHSINFDSGAASFTIGG